MTEEKKRIRELHKGYMDSEEYLRSLSDAEEKQFLSEISERKVLVEDLLRHSNEELYSVASDNLTSFIKILDRELQEKKSVNGELFEKEIGKLLEKIENLSVSGNKT
jgi:hypothetical protein